MKKAIKRRFLIGVILLAILACTCPGSNLLNPPTSPPTQPPEVQPPPPAGDTAPQTTEAPPPAPPEPTATVAHTTFPTSPGSLSAWVTDSSSSSYAAERRTDSDLFSKLFFERPFTSQTMDYQGHLDITRGEIFVGSPFVYVTIFLEGSPPTDSTAHYGIEIDQDRDGRGDWLVYGQVPTSSDWTSQGVRAYSDTNNDVGDGTPAEADGSGAGLNGYDNMIFDQGYNTTDPDGAWIRRDPSSPNKVQLAFKYSLIGSPSEFLWGVWSDEGPKNPAWFDYNDHFNITEAGSPDKSSSHYPLKALYSVDNSCRYTYGFTATTQYPAMCKLPTPPGDIAGGVYEDIIGTGERDFGDPGFPGVTVYLGSGACPSTGLKTTSTDSAGNYLFLDLQPGTYCVSVSEDEPCVWMNTTPESRTVTVTSGDTTSVTWFGYTSDNCY